MNTNLKSNLFLAGSCLSAIAAVGSVFELTSGSPDYGVALTTGILLLTAPLTIWFFKVAVNAARADQK
ncbi:MAG: hypothetical protein NW237_16820 [Cyanobacteriota bacterium]|nr:hypothetical protein [Cyanobacteriota bacterium]